jgi:pimeloyl-ACP methyl ester carboxylesterase
LTRLDPAIHPLNAADARTEVIPNTGHLVFLEAREKYDALLLGFLSK